MKLIANPHVSRFTFHVFYVTLILFLAPTACTQATPPASNIIIATAPPTSTAPTARPVATEPQTSTFKDAEQTAPTNTLIPTPRPTLVPLPKVCLRPAFADDQIRCGDVPRYELDLTVVLTTAQVLGHQKIHYTNIETTSLSDLYLRLFPNTPGYGGAMSVTQVLMNGQPTTLAMTPTLSSVYLPLTPALGIGDGITLDLDYVIDVPTTGQNGHGLFSYRYGVMALPTAYALIPVYDTRGWSLDVAPEYGDDVFADIALYTAHITAPAGLTLVASGSCTWSSAGGDLWTWDCEAGPMRDFVFVVGEDYERASRRVQGVVINSYYYARHRDAGYAALDFAAGALQTFSEHVGPYPYTELDVVETPNHLGGMEYPGLVVVEDSMYPDLDRLEWLTAHEVAHQWWFGVVGSDPIHEPWLDEALTQYSTLLYIENVYGPERAEAVRDLKFERTYRLLKAYGHDLPAGLPASAYGASLYWDVVYDKGALYFHNLRQAVGDTTFFEILQTYYTRHRYQIASAESFLATVQDVAGDPHQQLFNTWIAGEE